MKKTTLFLTFLFTSVFIHSQKVVIASGGTSVGNGSVSYSVGQIVYTTNSGSNGYVSQGIQQDFVFFSLTNPDFKELALEATTYPNPTQNKINLVLKEIELKGLTYKLFDVKGVEVSNGKVLENTTTINMNKMARGIYILKVNHQNKQLKMFKIIKR